VIAVLAANTQAFTCVTKAFSPAFPELIISIKQAGAGMEPGAAERRINRTGARNEGQLCNKPERHLEAGREWSRQEPSDVDEGWRVSCEARRVGYGAPVKCWEIIADNLSKAGFSWSVFQRLIPTGELSGLQTRIAETESVHCARR